MIKKFINKYFDRATSNSAKQYYDFSPFTGDRVKTEEGYLEVNVVATAVGVQKYDGEEVGFKPGTDIGLHRTADTVFHQDTIDSFKGKPVTIGHDGEMLNADTHKVFSFGNVMGDAFKIDNTRLGVRLLITDADTVRRIEDNELIGVSLGYTCEHIDKAGSLGDEKFLITTDGPMFINHVTLLPSSMPPRVEQARILDKQPEGPKKMDAKEIARLTAIMMDALKKDAGISDADNENIRKIVDQALKENEEAKKKTDAEIAEEEAKKKADTKDEGDDPEKKKTDAAKLDARINDAANLRAQVLLLCDAGTTSKTNTELLKAKLDKDYVNNDQAIGYLKAASKFDTDGRQAAATAFKGTKSGSNRIYSLDAIRNLKGKVNG